MEMKTFADFWPFYCREHSKPLTRNLHLVGSLLGPIASVAAFLQTGSGHAFWLWPLCGYGFAWVGHYGVEKNRPATFKHPLWSLMGDYVMVWKMLTGQMGEEMRKASAAR